MLFPPLRDTCHTLMARYSLFVLKVQLNNKQINKQMRNAHPPMQSTAVPPPSYNCNRIPTYPNRNGMWSGLSPKSNGFYYYDYYYNEKERSERRKRCMLAVVGGAKNFRPVADPLPGGAGRPKFNQLEMVTTCTYRPSLVSIDARNFELSW